MNPGLVGGLVGAGIGVLGGIIGTYFSIKNTNGPREKAYMIRCSVAVWAALTLFLVLLFALPVPYKYLLWIPYGLLLPWGILKMNRRQAAIREEEKSAS